MRTARLRVTFWMTLWCRLLISAWESPKSMGHSVKNQTHSRLLKSWNIATMIQITFLNVDTARSFVCKLDWKFLYSTKESIFSIFLEQKSHFEVLLFARIYIYIWMTLWIYILPYPRRVEFSKQMKQSRCHYRLLQGSSYMNWALDSR